MHVQSLWIRLQQAATQFGSKEASYELKPYMHVFDVYLTKDLLICKCNLESWVSCDAIHGEIAEFIFFTNKMAAIGNVIADKRASTSSFHKSSTIMGTFCGYYRAQK